MLRAVLAFSALHAQVWAFAPLDPCPPPPVCAPLPTDCTVAVGGGVSIDLDGCTVTGCPECRGTTVVCAADVFTCPDGSQIGRSGPDCIFDCPPVPSSIPEPTPLRVCTTADLFTGDLGLAIGAAAGDPASQFSQLGCGALANAIATGATDGIEFSAHSCCCLLAVTDDSSLFPDDCTLAEDVSNSLREDVELCGKVAVNAGVAGIFSLKDEICPAMAVPVDPANDMAPPADCDGRQLNQLDLFVHGQSTFLNGVCDLDAPSTWASTYGIEPWSTQLAAPPAGYLQPYTYLAPTLPPAVGWEGTDVDVSIKDMMYLGSHNSYEGACYTNLTLSSTVLNYLDSETGGLVGQNFLGGKIEGPCSAVLTPFDTFGTVAAGLLAGSGFTTFSDLVAAFPESDKPSLAEQLNAGVTVFELDANYMRPSKYYGTDSKFPVFHEEGLATKSSCPDLETCLRELHDGMNTLSSSLDGTTNLLPSGKPLPPVVVYIELKSTSDFVLPSASFGGAPVFSKQDRDLLADLREAIENSGWPANQIYTPSDMMSSGSGVPMDYPFPHMSDVDGELIVVVQNHNSDDAEGVLGYTYEQDFPFFMDGLNHPQFQSGFMLSGTPATDARIQEVFADYGDDWLILAYTDTSVSTVDWANTQGPFSVRADDFENSLYDRIRWGASQPITPTPVAPAPSPPTPPSPPSPPTSTPCVDFDITANSGGFTCPQVVELFSNACTTGTPGTSGVSAALFQQGCPFTCNVCASTTPVMGTFRKSHTAGSNFYLQVFRPFNFNCSDWGYENGDCL